MCGRYALSLRPSIVRQRLADQEMYAEDAPDDDDGGVRQTYNFAPGSNGLIYRATTSNQADEREESHNNDDGPPTKRQKTSNETGSFQKDANHHKYALKVAKWGLIPFWTKRPPDYASQMRTINCRDDSLIENRGMWNTMKQRKRCIVVAEGFYEWLKKNNGKEKIPHFVKRSDGQLMCFAGLWDMVQYEGSEDKLYTYTIITTDSNKQLQFLHDRMPVILESASEAMRSWLDPTNIGWSKDLQNLLKPFDGKLECYPVDQGVGKVGNNSPSFVIPVDSKENKKNIANFFDNQAANKTSPSPKKQPDESRETTNRIQSSEDNAPLPKPEHLSEEKLEQAVKKESSDHVEKPENVTIDAKEHIKTEPISDRDQLAGAPELTSKSKSPATPSPVKKTDQRQSWSSARKARNSTSNNTTPKTAGKDGNSKITSFFGK